jgi:large subunit ribosomal protein L22
MTQKTKVEKSEHVARAKVISASISTKHCVEICKFLRYKNTDFAKDYLESVIDLKKPIPFKKFNRDTGHKAGMAAGRFPQKAAKEFLKLVKSAEANAQFKGFNTSGLKITKILANKASIPATGGRHRRGTKRSHVEIEVEEVAVKKKENKKKSSKPATNEVKEEKQPETKVETKVEEKVELPKEEIKETNNQENQEVTKEVTKEEEKEVEEQKK